MINTLVDGNFLVIFLPSGNRYISASWASLDFTEDSVIITDQGKGSQAGVSYEIPFDKFQYNLVNYSTESDIFDALKNVIG